MVEPLPIDLTLDEEERFEKSEDGRQALIDTMTARVLQRLDLPPQDSVMKAGKLLRDLIQQDNSLYEVI